ncbi:MAG: hypothetical protein IIZ39_10420, partial [Blautia sp.]|nr:hypothetical protein [Blautia sp.]
MENKEELIALVTQAVMERLKQEERIEADAYFVESHFGKALEEDEKERGTSSLAGRTRMREKRS